MQARAPRRRLDAEAIDYINLHGTGTPARSIREPGVTSVFGAATPGSSTKGATGHTLGAAGALEAVISAITLRSGFMPGGVHTTHIDPMLTAHYLKENRASPASYVLSNSFGFGGTNCSLIFGRAGAGSRAIPRQAPR